MKRLAYVIAIHLAAAWPGSADPLIGPAEDLFHFAGYEWLEDGALFCLEHSCSVNGRFDGVYLVADRQNARLDVLLLGNATDLESAQFGTGCIFAEQVGTGRLYGSPNALIYILETPPAIAGENALIDVAVLDFQPLANVAPHIRVASILIAQFTEESFTDQQSQLAHRLLAKGDRAVVSDPAWPETWAVLRRNVGKGLADLDNHHAVPQLGLVKRTTVVERDRILDSARPAASFGKVPPPLKKADCIAQSMFSRNLN